MNRISGLFLFSASLIIGTLGTAHAGTATGLTGLYYTGVNNSGGLLAGGSQENHWRVTYATGGSAYEGRAYVISNPAGGWVGNTSTAQWITAPGNGGSDSLPGNGTTGPNAASYVYRLAFTIAGTGSGAVTNQVSITLTLAADDQAAVYVNPTINTADGSIDTANSRLGGSITSAWTNTRAMTLQNYADATHSDNATFVIGTNYLYIQVDNTNSQTGTSVSTALNPTGLIVYQTGAATFISPNPVPEVGAWLPVLGAFGLFCWRRFRSAKPLSTA
jgi:hypothetical protein